MTRLELEALHDPWRTVEPGAPAGRFAPALRLGGALTVGATATVANLAADGFHGRAAAMALVAIGWLAVLRWWPPRLLGLAAVVAIGAVVPMLTWSRIGRSPAVVLVCSVFVAHAAIVEWAPLARWPRREVQVAGLALLPLVVSQVIWFRDDSLGVTVGLLVGSLATVEAYHRAPSAMATADRRFAGGVVAFATAVGSVVLFAVVTVLLYVPGSFGRLADRVRRRRDRSSYWSPRAGSDEDLVRDAPRPFTSAAPRERLVRNLAGGALVVV